MLLSAALGVLARRSQCRTRSSTSLIDSILQPVSSLQHHARRRYPVTRTCSTGQPGLLYKLLFCIFRCILKLKVASEIDRGKLGWHSSHQDSLQLSGKCTEQAFYAQVMLMTATLNVQVSCLAHLIARIVATTARWLAPWYNATGSST